MVRYEMMIFLSPILPQCLQTYEMCLNSVNHHGYMLKYVREDLKPRNMFRGC